MEIIGTMLKILPLEEITLGDGTKKMKGGFVIMRDGEYAKPVAFELFGEDRLEMLNGLTQNMPVKVNFIASSREGKEGRYYTTLRCTNVVQIERGANSFAMPNQNNVFPLVASAPVTQVGTVPIPVAQNNGLQSQNQTFGELPPDEQLPFDNDLPFF